MVLILRTPIASIIVFGYKGHRFLKESCYQSKITVQIGMCFLGEYFPETIFFHDFAFL